jgi:hypothetical protein
LYLGYALRFESGDYPTEDIKNIFEAENVLLLVAGGLWLWCSRVYIGHKGEGL